MLTKDDVELHLAVLRSGLDPKSPFYRKVDFTDLLELPLDDQLQIHRAMPPDLLAMMEVEKKYLQEGSA